MPTDLIVCSHIDAHGKAFLWPDSTTGRVKAQLPDRDAHPVHSQVPQAQDALPVRHHHSLSVQCVQVSNRAIVVFVGGICKERSSTYRYVSLWPVIQDGAHVPSVHDGYEETSTETVAKLLTLHLSHTTFHLQPCSQVHLRVHF